MGDEVTVEVDAGFATRTPVLMKMKSSAKWHAAVAAECVLYEKPSQVLCCLTVLQARSHEILADKLNCVEPPCKRSISTSPPGF